MIYKFCSLLWYNVIILGVGVKREIELEIQIPIIFLILF